MEYAARLPRIPSRSTMVGPLVALVVGAGVATGAYALIDESDQGAQASKVIVVESPAPGTADIAGKNESATAAAISPQTGTSSTDEAATAAAISQSSGVDLRGSKASSTGTTGQDAAEAQRTDPHGPAISLRNP
jgi:hypothetical protein